MFSSLSKHQIIIVTGPHRSGTTIAAKMIAQDTGHDLVLEDDFGYMNLVRMITFIQADYGPLVIQCPFLSHLVHDLAYLAEVDMQKTLVVFMHRYRAHIIRSEENARVKNNKVDFERIAQGQKIAYHSKTGKHISDLKYESWEAQREMIPHYLDLGYESLREHDLWIEQRNFSVRQTDPDVEPIMENIKPPISEQLANVAIAIQNG